MSSHGPASRHPSESLRYRPLPGSHLRVESLSVRAVRALVRRPVALLMVLCAIAVVGSLSYSRIPVQQLPQGLEVPVMWLGLSFVNSDAAVSPQEIERTLAKPIEEQLASVPGIDEIRTASRSGSARIVLRFREGTDMSVAYAEVKDRIDRVRSTLEHELSPTRIGMVDPDSAPVAEYGLTFSPQMDVSEAFARIDEDVIPALEGLNGISNIELTGAINTFYEVQPRTEELAALGLDLDRLVRQLRSSNFASSIGKLEDGRRQYFLVADAKLRSLDDLAALPVVPGVRLGDIADIVDRTSFRDDTVFLNGRAAARLEIYKNSEANTVELCSAVERSLAEMQRDGRLRDFFVVKLNDDGEGIRKSVDNLMETALTGGLCAFFILILFLRRGRLTALIMLCTPLALLMALVALYFAGGSINMLSLVGFTLAVGMLVDNAVVVVESIARVRERDGDHDPEGASARGAGEVVVAVTLATLTTVAVFLPLMLLTGSAMLTFFMSAIGFPLCMALLASLFVAVVFVPAAARLLAGSKRLSPRHWAFLRWMRLAGAPALALPLGGAAVVLMVPAARASLGMPSGAEGVFVALGFALAVAAGLLVLLAALWWLTPAARVLDRLAAGSLNGVRGGYLTLLRGSLRHRFLVLGLVGVAVWGTLHVMTHGIEDVVEPLQLDSRPSQKPSSVRLRVSLPDNLELSEVYAIFAEYDRTIAGIQRHEAPLAALPADLDHDELRWLFAERITHDADEGTLTWLGIKTPQDVSAARELSSDERWRAAIDEIYRRAQVRRAEAPLDELPPGLDVEAVRRISRGRLTFDANEGMLRWRGGMTESQREALDELVAIDDEAEEDVGAPWRRALRVMQAELQLQAVKAYMLSFTSRGGSISLFLDPDDPAWEPRTVGNSIQSLLPTYSGVRVSYGWRGGGGGGGMGEQRLGVVLQGPDTEKLEAFAEQVVARLETIPELSDVMSETERGQAEVHLVLDRDASMAHGADPSIMARTLASRISGTSLPDLERPDGSTRRVQLRMKPPTELDTMQDRPVQRPDSLHEALDTPVPTSMEDGVTGTAPLRTFVLQAPEYRTGLSQIQRLDRRTSLEVTANVDRNADLAAIVAQAEGMLEQLDLPAGYTYTWGERVRSWRGMGGEITTAVLAAVFCVFVLMAIFFESLTKPFAIICTVPLAGMGAIWMLMITETPMDMVALVGAVILVGLIVNNGIVMIDLINRNVADGMTPRAAVEDACEHRFRPIVMTAATTIVGLIPMAVGTGTFLGTPYYPIALTVIGGLVSGTLLTLFVLPVLYTLIDDGLNGHALSRHPSRRQMLVAAVATVLFLIAAAYAYSQIPKLESDENERRTELRTPRLMGR